MSLIKIIQADLKRAFSGKLFWAGILASQGVFFLNIPWENFYGSVVYIIDLQAFGSFIQLTMLCGTIPFATAYLNDRKNGYMKLLIIRTDVPSYFWSKAYVTAFSGFATIFLAKILFAILLSLRFPITLSSSTASFQQFAITFLAESHPYLYVILDALSYAMGAAVFAEIALLCSCITRNAFATIMSPIVIFFFITSLHQIFSLSANLNITLLLCGQVEAFSDSIGMTLLYLFWFWFILLLIVGNAFVFFAKKDFYCD